MSDKRPKTVKVLIYFTADERAMACVMESEWRGPFRLDRRLSRTVPIKERAPAPHGVPANVWDAYQFLGQVIWDYVDARKAEDRR